MREAVFSLCVQANRGNKIISWESNSNYTSAMVLNIVAYTCPMEGQIKAVEKDIHDRIYGLTAPQKPWGLLFVFSKTP